MHFLKQIFIPNPKNFFRPHLIRRHGLAFVLLIVLGAQNITSLSLGARPQVLGYATDVTISGLLSNTNQQRSAAGKSNLSLNAKLNSAAQAKANHMIAGNYWAHTSPDGVTPWYWFEYAGYDYLVAGENLAYGFSTSAGVVNGWMNSPSHRDNMLNGKFEHVGFGIANGSNYQGGPNTVVVAMYGDPAVLAEQSPPPTAPAQAPPSKPAAKPQVVAAAEPKAEDTEEEKPKAADEEPASEADKTKEAPPVEEAPVGIAPTDAHRISNLEALLSGQAGWALYTAALAAVAVGFVYLYRHVLFIRSAVNKSEKFLVSHPMLEASIIYALIWLLLSGSFGSIL